MSVRILHDTKGAGLDALGKRLRELASKNVKVGVPKGAKPEEDGTSMALVAATVEFGHTAMHPDQPERPFLRGGIRSNLPSSRRIGAGAARAVAEGQMSADAALGLIGADAAGAVQKYMAGPNFEANADSTIAAKKSSQPTIGVSGALRQSITHIVEEGAL